MSEALLEAAERAAFAAAEAILEIYASDFAVASKSDASPLTLADSRSEAIILRHLASVTPDIPVISEEQAETEGLPASVPPRFWLVDPLDGTKEFIKRNGEFTVNIGLIEGGRPVLGVVGIPVKGLVYGAAGPGTARMTDAGGRVRAIAARLCPEEGATVTYSRSHADTERLEEWLAAHRIAARTIAGSALKFCLLAEGAADLYPRFGPTMEWDTAAGHALLNAVGGSVTMLDGTPFRYGKPGFRNPGFVAMGRPG
ncbi:MAG: 3(2), 5-bisphosphate nucleotidase [Aliidongia sp.]|jgi:3'(2'), 5'-bisphosphate nucleotidase|nr:3(2), 5-bisphosphate nucleotidase [Aliidongia sp.]